jgi:hypothetical protein
MIHFPQRGCMSLLRKWSTIKKTQIPIGHTLEDNAIILCKLFEFEKVSINKYKFRRLRIHRRLTTSNLPASQVHVLCTVAPCVVLPVGQPEHEADPVEGLYELAPHGAHDSDAPDPD